jgi:hypothetical protein
MSIEFKNAPTGYYTTFHIISIAQMQMPEEYDALLDPSELVWEDVSVAGFYDKALFVGYINIAPAGICKVLACMTSDGAIQFYTRGGLRLSRLDNGQDSARRALDIPRGGHRAPAARQSPDAVPFLLCGCRSVRWGGDDEKELVPLAAGELPLGGGRDGHAVSVCACHWG